MKTQFIAGKTSAIGLLSVMAKLDVWKLSGTMSVTITDGGSLRGGGTSFTITDGCSMVVRFVSFRGTFKMV